MTMCAASCMRLSGCTNASAAPFRTIGNGAALLCRAGFNSSLMLVSAALGRVAGQGFYGVAQAAFYRFEALLYSAAASGEGYG